MNRCYFRCFEALTLIADLKKTDPASLDPNQDAVLILKKDTEDMLHEHKGKFSWVILSMKDADMLTPVEIHILMDVFRTMKMKLVDVPASMYEGLLQSGIYGRFEVLKKLRRVDTESLELVGAGYTSKVYRYSDDKILKVFAETMPLSDIIDEREKSRFLFMNAARFPITYELVRCGRCYGIIFEFLGRENLLNAFLDKNTDHFELAEKYGVLMRNTAVPVGRDGMVFLKSQKQNYLNGIRDCEDLLTEEETRKVRAEMKKIPAVNRLLHGDCHIENIMIIGNELFLIDAMTLAKGHPILDLVCPYMCFYIWPEFKEIYDARTPEDEKAHPVWYGYISRYEATALDKEEGAQLWKVFLKAYFGERDEEFYEKVTVAVRILNEIKFGCYMIRNYIPEDMMWGYNHWAMGHFRQEDGIPEEIFSEWE